MRCKVWPFLFMLGSSPLAVPGQVNMHWRFGAAAGIDFSSGTAVPVVGTGTALEGTASMCNANGELLFWTDGLVVRNRDGVVMPGGTGLLGSPSSSQTVIVPQPGHCDRFYIFTTTDMDGDRMFRYTVVDLCASQGLGSVIPSEKNVVLQTGTTEAVVAVPHANGTDVWVIVFAFAQRTFHAFLLTDQGIAPTPISSEAGTLFNPSQGVDQLEGSHGNDKLVHVASGVCDLLDLDPASGTVSNGVDLCSRFGFPSGGYDAVFSPDDTKLYVTTGGWDTVLRQLDLLTNTTTVLGTWPIESGGFGGIQLGPDGKVYVARRLRYYLDVIHEPDLPGTACGHVDQGLPMPRSCRYGLPSALTANAFRNMTSRFQLDLGPDITACPGTPLELSVAPPCNATMQWSTGSRTDHALVYAPDTLVVHIEAPCASGTDSLIIHVEQDLDDASLEPPNVLTPNGDGVNDTWRPASAHDVTVHYIIFDRWGNTIASSTGEHDHWDGRHHDGSPAADGVYYYTCALDLQGPCSSYTTREQGHITLLR